MDKQIVDRYRVSGNQKTHIELSKFSVSENESLSMLNRYGFCEDDEPNIEEWHKNTEKNYQETKKINYLASYRELLKYSSWELFKQLSDKLLPSYERRELLKSTIVMVIMVIVDFIITFKLFDNIGISLILGKIPNIIIGILYIVVPLLVAYLVAAIVKQVIANKKKNKKKIIGFIKPVICTAGFVFTIININDVFSFINVTDILNIETDNIEIIVEASELYGSTPDSTEFVGDQIIYIGEEDTTIKLDYLEGFLNSVEETYKSIEFEYFYDLSNQNEEVVACDLNGKEYTLSQLSDQKLLIPYTDGGKEVLFYGQYNKYCWDGECIFNIYEYNEDIGKNVLTTILEAQYDNENLVSYKKITKATTGQGVDVWSISDRIREKDYNRGETYYYLQSKDYLQDFDIDTAGVENIIFFENFENILKNSSTIEGYYYGNTSDGYYNDDTGNAYMVKYAEDGTVRTFYRGGFKNGFPDDQTGNALQIVFDGSNNVNKYFYYKGMFKNGSRVGRVTSNNYVELAEIDQIIDVTAYNCELPWNDTVE